MNAPIVFKKRTKKGTERKAPPPPPSDSESSGSEGSGDEVRIAKRRKTGASTLKVSTEDQKAKGSFEGTTKFDADRSTKIEASNDATKQSNWFEEDAKDAMSEKNLLGTTRTKPQSFIQKNPDAPDKKYGPMKAATNIRTITITDYAPDVCKDYKQTGFCGFGDSCKFLHAREDYAAGWKLDREWEMSGKDKKGGTVVSSANRNANEKDEDGIDVAMLEKIPFACIVCKKAYTRPIMTKCGHYFCEACALKRYRKDPSCAACGANTGGIFNGAKNLQKLLEKKQKLEDKKKDEAKEDEEGNGND